MPKIQAHDTERHVYRELNYRTCKRIVEKRHYSGKMPANVQYCYGVVHYGPPKKVLACCVFTIPPSRWEGHLWELARLVRVPHFEIPLTKIVSKAIKGVRSNKGTDLIVSFADAEKEHHGGIYQSCSWLYSGVRDQRLDGFMIGGNLVPVRTCNSKWGTSSEEGLRELFPNKEIEPHYDSGKYLYWKPLNKQGLERGLGLGLRSLAYPKPALVNGRMTTIPHLRKGKRDLKGRKK